MLRAVPAGETVELREASCHLLPAMLVPDLNGMGEEQRRGCV